MSEAGWRRHATTIVLLSLAVSLGVYVLVVDRGSITTAESELRKHNLFPFFRRDELARVVIERTDGQAPIRLRRQSGDDFELEGEAAADPNHRAPAETADTAAVRRLLSALEFAVVERTVDRDLDR